MTKGKREPTDWQLFVTKIYEEGHTKDSKYTFKQAMQDASERKNEMVSKGGKSSKQKGTKRRGKKGKKTMKRRK
jgi:hypothetical protein